MATDIKKFVLGADKIPEWFNQQCAKGRAKLIIEDDELKGAKLFLTAKVVEVKTGDTIVLSKYGLAVVKDNGKKAQEKAGKKTV